MIIPIRCFSCGGLIAHKWEEYKEKIVAGIEIADALDQIDLTRYCCRRMYVGHHDLIEEIAPFSTSLK